LLLRGVVYRWHGNRLKIVPPQGKSIEDVITPEELQTFRDCRDDVIDFAWDRHIRQTGARPTYVAPARARPSTSPLEATIGPKVAELTDVPSSERPDREDGADPWKPNKEDIN
jgi:hypothetical protein